MNKKVVQLSNGHYALLKNAVPCEDTGEYELLVNAFVTADGLYYADDTSLVNTIYGVSIHIDNSIRLINGDYTHDDDENLIKLEDGGWTVDCSNLSSLQYIRTIDGGYYSMRYAENNLYCNDDGDWSTEPFDDWDDNDNYGYHDQEHVWLQEARTARWRVGFEIEKEDINPKRAHYKEDLYSLDWVRENDGSLDEKSGYELVSPVFPLEPEFILTHINSRPSVVDHINGEYSSACGGHIHLSSSIESPKMIVEMIDNYIPLLYAMYPKRAARHYCKAVAKNKITGRERRAICLTENTVEFRIFPAVVDVDSLYNRAKLLQFMTTHLNATTAQITRWIEPEQPLGKIIQQEGLDCKNVRTLYGAMCAIYNFGSYAGIVQSQDVTNVLYVINT
jgi:hypothetical protein